jgi:Histidine kinase-, DNA gyrase B-, and HSP90-like ATPase
LPRHFKGDPGRIRQILLNLMSNALKFTQEGFIRIGVHGERSESTYLLKVWVQDTGIGVSPEAQKRLFQSFSQAESDTSRKFGGTGLGLAICMKLSQLMGGTMKLTSEPGLGSTFSLEIPIPEALVQTPTEFQGKDWTGAILICASSEIGRISLTDECDALGLEYHVTSSWDEARRLLVASPPVIAANALFVHMPMKQWTSDFHSGEWRRIPELGVLPSFYFTHCGMRGDAQRVRECAFDGFLSLPMKSGLLGQLLAAVMRREYRHQPHLPLITRFNVNDEWVLASE